MKFKYLITRDSDGVFIAIVTNPDDKPVYRICLRDEEAQDDFFDNHRMKNKNDLGGLKSHLVYVKAMAQTDTLTENVLDYADSTRIDN